MFAVQIRQKRAQRVRSVSAWRWPLDEKFIRFNGVHHNLWRGTCLRNLGT
jgi:putative transposase